MSLSLEQKEAIEITSPYKRLLITAGAGAGKTKVITERALRLAQKDQMIWMTTFTQNAAQEIQNRLNPQSKERIQVRTIDKLFLELFDFYETNDPKIFQKAFPCENSRQPFQTYPDSYFYPSLQNEVQNWLKYLSQKEFEKALPFLMQQMSLPSSFSFLSKQDQITQLLLQEICLNPDLQITLTHTPFSESSFAKLKSMAQKAQKKRFQRREITFLDVSLGLKTLLEQRPFPHPPQELIVDEYQDTNQLQHTIFQELTHQSHWTIVGDVKQSLYGFRDAQVEILQSLQQAPKWTKIHLKHNYRCHPHLLTSINDLSTKLFQTPVPSHAHPQIQPISFEPMLSERETTPLTTAPLHFLKTQSFDNKSTFQAFLNHFQQEKKENPHFHFALLTQTNQQIRQITQWLSQTLGDPSLKLPSLQEKEQGSTILNLFLKLLHNPQNLCPSDWYIFLASPLVQIPVSRIQPYWFSQESLIQEHLHPLHIDQLKQAFPFKPFDTCRRALQQLESRLTKSSQKTLWKAFWRANEPIWLKLYEKWQNDPLDPKSFPPSFLSFPTQNRSWHIHELTLSTIHSAKGLEWDHIYIWPLLKDSQNQKSLFQILRFQNQLELGWQSEDLQKKQNQFQLLEKQRLFYTALTRAKEKVSLLSPWISGATPKHHPLFSPSSPSLSFWSQFLKDQIHSLPQETCFETFSEPPPLSMDWFPATSSLCRDNTKEQFEFQIRKDHKDLERGLKGHQKAEIFPEKIPLLKDCFEKSKWNATEWEVWQNQKKGVKRSVLDAICQISSKEASSILNLKNITSNYIWIVFEFKFTKLQKEHENQLKTYCSLIQALYQAKTLGMLLHLHLDEKQNCFEIKEEKKLMDRLK